MPSARLRRRYPRPARCRDSRPRILVTTPIHLRLLLAEAEALAGGGPGAVGHRAIGRWIWRATPRRDSMPSSRRSTAVPKSASLPSGAPPMARSGAASTHRAAAERIGHLGGRAPIAIESPLADLIELRDPRHFRLLGRTNGYRQHRRKRSSLAHLNARLTPSKST